MEAPKLHKRIPARKLCVTDVLCNGEIHLGDRLLSSAGNGKNCALSIRFPDPSPILDKNRAPMGPDGFVQC